MNAEYKYGSPYQILKWEICYLQGTEPLRKRVSLRVIKFPFFFNEINTFINITVTIHYVDNCAVEAGLFYSLICEQVLTINN
jgi:hypothetical protein